MTPTHSHTDTPLRRSEIGVFRIPVETHVLNDDEEERRQARRRTIIEDTSTHSTLEDNETLKKCLKIYNENKLSKENAWSVSLIDTLSALLEKHHKSLNNFKVAGSSLEASSKVYGLRVDSIHTDVLRMSAGLNKQKLDGKKLSEIDNSIENEDTECAPVQESEQGGGNQRKPKKRARKQVSTITKNKDTINSWLDTLPFTDPIFAKLNSTVASINSSNRLLQNILQSENSELKLRMDFRFWDSKEQNLVNFPEECSYDDCMGMNVKFFEVIKLDDLKLRPNHSGYIVADTPAELDARQENDLDSNSNDKSNTQIAVAFDMNAEVEQIAADTPTFFDVDIGGFDDLTVEEQLAINNCRGLRRVPVMIDDMRPIDSTSILEYSYRPLDKISQFWAGPSHWKFKKKRNKSLSIRNCGTGENIPVHNQQGKRKTLKLRPLEVQFSEPHDDLFQKLDERSKMRKANIQKKWDAKKLKLPTDLQFDKDIFDKFIYAPGLNVCENVENTLTPYTPTDPAYNYSNCIDQEYCSNIPNNEDYVDDMHDDCDAPNETVVEIATEFSGTPDMIQKILVPFAKRAKVIDMKQLKKCCMKLIQSQINDANISKCPMINETEIGVASFKKVYIQLPKLLTYNMVEALSPSVVLYSILHLANDFNLQLIQQEDLNDFKIRLINI